MTATPVKTYPVFRHCDDETGVATSVYRIFDHRDRLLYVGVAQDVEHRIYMHMATYTTPGWLLIHKGNARHESVEYPSRKAARAAEAKAIAAEKPWLNRQHNPSRWRRVAGQYQPVDAEAWAELERTIHDDYLAHTT